MQRKGIGKIIIDFPIDYTVVDIKTPEFQTDIIKITAFKFKNKRIFSVFTSESNITETLLKFVNFVGDDIIIDLNASFDIKFIYDTYLREFGKIFSNNFVSVIKIARKLYPDIPNYQLYDTTKYLSVFSLDRRDKLNNCSMTFLCYEKMRDDVIKKYGTVEAFKDTL